MEEFNPNFELDINHIVTLELRNLKTHIIPERLKLPVIQTLAEKGVFVKLKDFLADKKIKSFDNLSSNEPDCYEKSKEKINGEWTEVVYDYLSSCDILPADRYYNFFFAYKLRQAYLYEIDSFLNYHLSKYYNDDFNEFNRFLTLTLRMFDNIISDPKSLATINEWIETTARTPQKISNDLSGPTDVFSIRWTGGKLDLIRLVYALYHSKNINDGHGEILKVIEVFAKQLGISIKNKDHTLYSSINQAKKQGHNFYAFFDKLKNDYKTHVIEPRINK